WIAVVLRGRGGVNVLCLHVEALLGAVDEGENRFSVIVWRQQRLHSDRAGDDMRRKESLGCSRDELELRQCHVLGYGRRYGGRYGPGRHSTRNGGRILGCGVILNQKRAKQFCQLSTVADHVPIAIIHVCSIDQCGSIGWINVWLIGRIPIAA